MKNATTTLHVTIDTDTKKAAADLASQLGLDLSTIVKASLKAFVRTKTFHVEKVDQMTPYLEKIIAQAKADTSADSPVFASSKAAKKWLLSK